MNKVETVKTVINPYITLDCNRLYFSGNIVRGKVQTLYEDDDVTVLLSCDYGYFEVLGLSSKEEDELAKWFDDVIDELRLNLMEQMTM